MSKQVCETPKECYQPGSMAEVFQLIRSIEKKLKHMQRQTMRGANLTPPQYVALSLLWEKDERPFKELADGCQCSRATMTGIADTLEKKGLITREPNPDDRRSILAKLTEKGKSLQNSAPGPEQVFGGCCSCLEPDETQQLSSLLKKLNNAL